MFDRKTRLPIHAAVPLFLCLGAAVAAAGAVAAESPAASLRCEIETRLTNGMIAIEGVVYADAAVAGSYLLRVVSAGSSGNSDIEQGGAFTAGPDRKVTLGQVILGARGSYKANLDLTVDGKSVTCSERVSG